MLAVMIIVGWLICIAISGSSKFGWSTHQKPSPHHKHMSHWRLSSIVGNYVNLPCRWIHNVLYCDARRLPRTHVGHVGYDHAALQKRKEVGIPKTNTEISLLLTQIHSHMSWCNLVVQNKPVMSSDLTCYITRLNILHTRMLYITRGGPLYITIWRTRRCFKVGERMTFLEHDHRSSWL